MAVLRIWKGSVLEENIARTSGTIGEGIAAGAIFTIPAFLIAKAWPSFRPADAYWKTTALIMVGSVLGVLFISLVRRVMVEDPELPFPESVAASELHKAGQRGAQAAKYLFWNIGVGGVVYMLGRFGLFASDQDLHFAVGSLGRSQVRLGAAGSTNVVAAGGTSMMAAPSVSPAYLGVGYIIGLRLASIQFAGGVLAWGLLVPLMIFVLMCFLYINISGLKLPAILAAVVMLIVGFFFATVSGSLCGFIGSSNNPVSGLTLSTLLIAALLMVFLGVSGTSGVATVLGVAAVVCVSSSVAGELLQDFKVGYILGGTPRRIQLAELIAVVVASLVMYWPLMLLHEANIKAGGIGFGDRQLSAPQAGLMATLAMGIVGGDMPWPLVVVGIFFGIAMIMMQVRSPMLVAVGMYLPFETTFAIFIGGVFRSLGDWLAKRRGFNEAQMTRVDNAGVLTASGLIAGEAVLGLVWAGLQFAPKWARPQIFSEPSYLFGGMIVMFLLAILMIGLPLTVAGDPSEPAPPKAIM